MLKVWIDQDLCTGDGLCEEVAPEVFTLLPDGLAYVKQDGHILCNPGGSAAVARIPTSLEDDAIEAAQECPGECIYIEPA